MKTHDGTRDFGCDICGCRFTTNGSLKRHMIVHSDERYSIDGGKNESPRP
jgi:hypothetical protein